MSLLPLTTKTSYDIVLLEAGSSSHSQKKAPSVVCLFRMKKEWQPQACARCFCQKGYSHIGRIIIR